MMKRLFFQATGSVVSAAALVACFSVLSRLVGFFRDRILAGMFGAGDTLDVYFTAFRIPDLMFNLIIVGALSASFIPIFTQHFKTEKDKAWRYTSNVLNIFVLLFLAVAILGTAFSPIIAKLVAPGFSALKQDFVAKESSILFLGQIFFAISMVFGSVLQSTKRFLLYSVAPIVYNLGIIFGALFFVPVMGPLGLAWGTVLGAATHALVQTAGAYGLGYRYRWSFSLDRDMITTLRQMVPRMLGLAVNQVNFLVMTSFASLLAAGSVTVLQFSYNLNFFVVGVIGVSYAIAAFPTFCEVATDKDRLRGSISSTVRQVLFFVIPATVLFVLLRAQLVRLVFGAGDFDWPATIATADALAFFAISFFAQCLVFVLVRAFFALKDTWTPFCVGLLGAGVNLGLGYWLLPHAGVAGLTLAFSVAAMLQFAMLWVLLRSQLGSLDESRILRSALILSIAGLLAAFVTQVMKTEFVNFIADIWGWELNTFHAVLGQLLVTSAAGLLVYFGAAMLLRSPEVQEFSSGLRSKFLRSAKPTEPVTQENSAT